MAQTTQVQIGGFTMPVSRTVAEALDAYSQDADPTTFSPIDVCGLGDSVKACEGRAIEIVAQAMDPNDNDPTLRAKMQALINLSNATQRLSQQVQRVSDNPPHENYIGGFLELEFTADQWERAGGYDAMWALVVGIQSVQKAFDAFKIVFPGRFISDAYATQVPPSFRPVVLNLTGQLNWIKSVLRAPHDCNPNLSASDLECEGKGCPKDDEVTGSFCLPTFYRWTYSEP